MSIKKMVDYANKILEKEVQLKDGDSVVVKLDQQFTPFVKVFCEEAYKKGAKDVCVEVMKPEIDAFQKKYCKEAPFSYKQIKKDYYENIGAKTLLFDKNNNPYELSGLTEKEINDILNELYINIPVDVQKEIEEAFDVKEIYHVLLNIQKGQPIRIAAEREHEKNVLRFVEYAYKNGCGPIDVFFTEYGNPFSKAKLKYAKEEYIKFVPDYVANMWRERVDRHVAGLFLEGEDPEGMADVPPKNIVSQMQAFQKIVKPIRKSGPESQWNIIYAPTTMSVKRAYSEIKDIMQALKQAAIDAKAINRIGKIEEHSDNLTKIANKMNEYSFKEIHFYSINPETKEPDGKTDLFVGMHEKSRFRAAATTTDDGIVYMANTPTEEVFSSPDKTKTHGWVYATLPLCLDGNMIEGIKMRFENGKAVEIYADKNQEMWQEHIKTAKDGDMLGEVSLVADSPIYHTGRIFYDTLLDENATCHIAVGEAFDECVEGAQDITDYKKRQEYLKENNINDSTIHTDFMIGGLNVIVEGIKPDGEKILLIKDNKFQI